MRSGLSTRLLGASGLALCLLLPAEASAEPTPPAPVPNELHEALRLAVENHPRVGAAAARQDAAWQRVEAADRWPDARVEYGHFLRPVETRLGPQEHRVGISQRLPWFGTLGLREEVARQSAHVVDQQFAVTVLEVRRRAAHAWYDYYLAGRRLEIADANVALLTRLEDVVISRYEASRAPYSSVLQIRIEREKAQDEVLSRRHELRPALARLNESLSLPLDTERPIPSRTSLDVAAPDAAPDWWSSTPRIEALRSAERRERERARLVRREQLPDLALSAQYIFTGKDDDLGGPDVGRDALVAGISLDLPLDRGALRSEREAQESEARAAQLVLDDAVRQLRAEHEVIQFAHEDALRRAALLTNELLPAARETLRIAEDDFVTGIAEFSHLIDGHRTLLELELAYEEARVDAAKRAADLTALLGGDTESNEEAES